MLEIQRESGQRHPDRKRAYEDGREKDLQTLRICSNSAYYLVKQECPFSDYPNLITLQYKNGIKKFQSYMTDRAAADFTGCIAEVKKEKI